MRVINIIHEDFANYRKPGLFIGFPKCSGKCNLDAGMIVCQNNFLHDSPSIEISTDVLIREYLDNPITKCVICGGLEPFDTYSDLLEFVAAFRKKSADEIIIYTGYTESELAEHLPAITAFGNIIIKFGRFVPNQERHFDEILGVWLASANQYAVRF